MSHFKNNLVLIGMPGAGKTTIGRFLSKHLGMNFIDADQLIEQTANLPIQSIVNNWGLAKFTELEESVLCDLSIENAIISTGGSAVYSHRAMSHLGYIGCRVYLKITANTLIRRVTNQDRRGLYKLPGHDLMRLFRDREHLYPNYADITFDNDRSFTASGAYELVSLIKSQEQLKEGSKELLQKQSQTVST